MAQTYQNIEIIVVDDNPWDYSEKDEIKEAVIRTCPTAHYISHGENRGASAARNTGIREANGLFVAFLDDDDEWLPKKLKNNWKDLHQKVLHLYTVVIF